MKFVYIFLKRTIDKLFQTYKNNEITTEKQDMQNTLLQKVTSIFLTSDTI